MPYLNRITVMGHAGRDPEITTAKTGASIARFSVATAYSYKKGDEWHQETTWHNVTVFGDRAERAARIHKGDLVYVEGRQEHRAVDKDGERKTYASIVADKVELLHTRSDNDRPRTFDDPIEDTWSKEEDRIPF